MLTTFNFIFQMKSHKIKLEKSFDLFMHIEGDLMRAVALDEWVAIRRNATISQDEFLIWHL